MLYKAVLTTRYVWILICLGSIAVPLALRHGFSRRRMPPGWAAGFLLLVLAGGPLVEQLNLRDFRRLFDELGAARLPNASMYMEAAQADALAARLFGVSIFVFGSLVIGAGYLVRAIARWPAVAPSRPAAWRLAASTALLILGTLIATPNLATTVGALIHPLATGAAKQVGDAVIGLFLALLLGWVGVRLREPAAAVSLGKG